MAAPGDFGRAQALPIEARSFGRVVCNPAGVVAVGQLTDLGGFKQHPSGRGRDIVWACNPLPTVRPWNQTAIEECSSKEAIAFAAAVRKGSSPVIAELMKIFIQPHNCWQRCTRSSPLG
jgi:hypothetical protein